MRLKSYAGNPNSIADSILELLFNPELCANVAKAAKAKVKSQYNWNKIAQRYTFLYIKKQFVKQWQKSKEEKSNKKKQRKQKKAKNTEGEITNLLSFKKRHAYA